MPRVTPTQMFNTETKARSTTHAMKLKFRHCGKIISENSAMNFFIDTHN